MLKNEKEILMNANVDPEFKFDIIKTIEEFKKFFDHGRKVAAFIGPSIVGMTEEKREIAIGMTEEKVMGSLSIAALFNDYLMSIRAIMTADSRKELEWQNIEGFKSYAKRLALEAKVDMEEANWLYPEPIINVKKFAPEKQLPSESTGDYMNRCWLEIVHIVDDCWKVCEDLLEDTWFL